MRYLKFIVLLIVIFSLTNCEKQTELVNKTTDAQIVGLTFFLQRDLGYSFNLSEFCTIKKKE